MKELKNDLPRQISIRGYCFAMHLHAIIWGRAGSAVAPFGHFDKAIARQNVQKWSFFRVNFEVLKSYEKQVKRGFTVI